MGGSPPRAGVGYPGASPPDTAHAGGSLRARLLAATHAEHARINRHPRLAGLTRPGYSLAQYRTLLPVYHRFYGLVEGAVLERLKADAVDFSYQERRKLPWLDQDLAVLGLSPPVLGAGPACRTTWASPPPPGPASFMVTGRIPNGAGRNFSPSRNGWWRTRTGRSGQRGWPSKCSGCCGPCWMTKPLPRAVLAGWFAPRGAPAAPD
jgi:hypothetical protein